MTTTLTLTDIAHMSKAELARRVAAHPAMLYTAHHPSKWRKDELVREYAELLGITR